MKSKSRLVFTKEQLEQSACATLNKAAIDSIDNPVKFKESVCPYCNKNFNAKIYSRKNNRIQKYCSTKCRVAANNKNRIWSNESKQKASSSKKNKYSGENNPNYKACFDIKTCLYCNQQFKLPYRAQQSGKFCSRNCYKLFTARNRKSEIEKNLYKIFGRNISHSLKRGKDRCKWTALVGYTLNDLRVHLQSKFTDGMTWDNYGRNGWNVDHIKPLSWFKFSHYTDFEFQQAWALNNLQPLWQKDNFKKGNRYAG